MIMRKQDHNKIADGSIAGLTQTEADRLLAKFGPNSIPIKRINPWLVFINKLWAPVPWMLEVSILLEITLGKYTEAGVIGALLMFNALVSTFQERRAQNALSLLRQKLTVVARVLRDGTWREIPSAMVVPGDILHLRMGDLVPADLNLLAGQLLLDQSSLTGESMPVEAGIGSDIYAGTVIRRGEAEGKVITTGMHTRFGRTADLVSQAKTQSQLSKIVYSIVKNLIFLDAALLIVVFVYSLVMKLPFSELIPFVLILLVASVPIALPATFTLATALGTLDLAESGVLVTNLNAIEEAATMQVLCTDKTGTLTQNKLTVVVVEAIQPYTGQDVLKLAALASDESTQDPLDMAILEKVKSEKMDLAFMKSRQELIPFESSTKRSEAVFKKDDYLLRALKGAPQVIASLDKKPNDNYMDRVNALEAKGNRVLGIASGTGKTINIAGLIAFEDPPRLDSTDLIRRLRDLGIRVIMITGDGLETAKAIANRLGIGNKCCQGEKLKSLHAGSKPCDVYAEVLPEDKYKLVQLLQKGGQTVGMTGDGVNDAPALKQAEVGIAVSSATDVAKAAASLVLTSPGLSNLLAAINTSRQIYQRMLTYTLNKIIKTIEIAFFLTFGLLFTGTFITTPLLMVLLLFTNDFVTMTISTDHVTPSSKPNRWNIRMLVLSAVILAVLILGLSFGILWYANSILKLPLANLQTLIFVMLVFSGQGTIYLVRERRHFWHSRPSKWMVGGTVLDISIVILMAARGILMSPVPLILLLELLGSIIVFLILLDFIKVPVFSRLGLH